MDQFRTLPSKIRYFDEGILICPCTLNIASIWYMTLHMNFNQTIGMYCKGLLSTVRMEITMQTQLGIPSSTSRVINRKN